MCLRPDRFFAALASTILFVGTLALSCATNRAEESDESPDLVGSPASEPARTPRSEAPPEPSNEPDPNRRGTLWYRFELGPSHIDVTLRLVRPAEETAFFLPNHDGDDRISLRGARGPEGAVNISPRPAENRIDVATAGLQWVELDYRVGLEPAGVGSTAPESTGDRVLAFLPRMLVVPSRQVVRQIRDIPVEIHAPARWRLLTTWPEVERKDSASGSDRTVHGFVARDLSVLRDAYFVAGPNLNVDTTGGGDGDIRVAYGPELAEHRETLTGRVSALVAAYRRSFGSTGAVAAFFRKQDGDGLRGTGKRGGFVVEVPPEAPDGRETDLLIAHEAFHLWNGHRLRPDPEYEEATRWFKEGVTHYVALKFLHETGRYSLDQVRTEIAKSMFYYRHNPASGGERASRLDLHRLPYDRGVLLALALDAAIADCTDGDRRLEDWMRRLLRDPETAYGPERLRATLRGVTPDTCRPARRTWSRHVARDRPLAPADIAESAGLHLLTGSTADDTRLLPLENRGDQFRRLFTAPEKR